MVVHLIDGTYELFRHFYGLQRSPTKPPPLGAVRGVLSTVIKMIEDGATHIGVATDHVIESFRNDLWPGYKTGYGIDPELWTQFEPLEEALEALGVVVWPMVEFEADDALCAAAHLADEDERVQKVCIWTPDKDLAQCVRDDRVVQIDRRREIIRDISGVQSKWDVDPEQIPDYLALVGDSADGFPGIKGIGPKTASRLLAEYGAIDAFPAEVMSEEAKEQALLFKVLATLRSDVEVFDDVDDLKWDGPQEQFGEWAEQLGIRKIPLPAHTV